MKNLPILFLLFCVACSPTGKPAITNQAPPTTQAKVKALAAELESTDPDVAAMLYAISGSIAGGDFTRKSMHSTIIAAAKDQRAYLMQQAAKSKDQ